MKSNLFNSPFILLTEVEWQSLGNNNTLPARHIHHLRKSLRFKGQLQLNLGNGQGSYKSALLTEDNILSQVATETSTFRKYSCNLLQVGIKRKNLEWIIQKTSELGINKIDIIISDYCNHPAKNIERLQLIAQNAIMQSRNLFLPEIKIHNTKLVEHPPFQENDNTDSSNFDNQEVTVWGHHSGRSLSQVISTRAAKTELTNITFINGPEGGWSRSETEWLKNRFPCIFLSDNVLRSETAAVCFTSQAAQIYDYKRKRL